MSETVFRSHQVTAGYGKTRNRHLSLTIILNWVQINYVPPTLRKHFSRLIALPAVLLLLGACAVTRVAPQSNDFDDPSLTVATSIYPITFATKMIAGTDAEVTPLLPEGADAHHGEISLRQLRQLREADLVIYLSGFQPAVDQAIAANPPPHIIDIGDLIELRTYEDAHDHSDEDPEDDHGHDHGEGTLDPHFWLNPENMATVTDAVTHELGVLDEQNAEGYAERGHELSDDFREIAADYERELSQCARDTIVVSHAAFSYLTEPHGISQLGISGLDPDSEPSLVRIREVRDAVKEQDITTIFYESPTNPYVAEKVADSLGLTTALLDPLEYQIDPETDFLESMRNNLDVLTTALDCQ